VVTVALNWSGKDAYDEAGTRVATVERYRDRIPGGGRFGPSVRYWHAFVAHDHVLGPDGEPGRWATEAEAKAAALLAYLAHLAEHGGRFVLPGE
jgi:hypothetical protein